MYFQLLRRTDYAIMGLRRLHLLISSDATELISSASLLTGIKPRIKHLEREMTLQCGEKCVVTGASDEIKQSFHTFPYLQ